MLDDLTSPARRDRLRWAVRVRWLAIGGFSVLAVAAWSTGVLPSLRASAVAAVLSAIVNAANQWCVARGRFLRSVTALAVPADVVLITYLIVCTGGAHSPFIMLYVVQVVATAMLVDGRVAALIAVASAAAFLTGAWALPAAPASPAETRGGVYQLLWGLFLFYCLALLTLLGGYIAERLRRSEDDLAARNEHLRVALGSLELAHADLQRTVTRLIATEAQLVQSEKLRALGQFVAGIAHELNNPIGFVVANLEHLRRAFTALEGMLAAYAAVPVPAAGAQALADRRRALRVDELCADLPSALADCEEGARRAGDIVASLRTFARADRPNAWTRVDLHERLDRTLALARSRLGGARIERQYGALPSIECLAGQLDQVWLNLLANAADAVGGQGTIAIHTWSEPHRNGIPQVAVRVADDGPGMPPDVRSRVFEPFFTTKPEGQGTGLGLSVSYAIVERHRGAIEIDCPGGGGTAVTVYLPVAQVGGAK